MSLYNEIFVTTCLLIIGCLVVAHHRDWISKRTRDSIVFGTALIGAFGVLVPLVISSQSSTTKDAASVVGSETKDKTAEKVPEALINRIALKLMYGDDAMMFTDDSTNTSYVQWRPTPAQHDQFFGSEIPAAWVSSKILLTLPYYSNNTDNYLVLTASSPYSEGAPETNADCHACAPVIGGAVLSLRDGVWTVSAKTLDIGNIGEWGKIPDGNLVVIGKDHYAVIFELTYIAQGDRNVVMTMIGQVGSELRVLLDVPVSGSNIDGSCALGQEIAKEKKLKFNYQAECYKYTSRRNFIMDESNDYYELIIKYAGEDYDENSKDKNNRVKDVTRTDFYKFNGKEFKLIDTIKQAPEMPEEFDENI